MVCGRHILFIITRWFLNFEYNQFFGAHFTSAADYSRYLGWYTMAGMAVSLAVQLLFLNRWVARVGLGWCFSAYHMVLVAVVAAQLVRPSLLTATLARFVETDLRMGMRNPLNMMISNEFNRAWRPKVRTLSHGLAVPVATLVASGMLWMVVQAHHAQHEPLSLAGKAMMLVMCGLLLVTVWRMRRLLPR
ncbi:MAG: hypothetical protein R2857_12960 [Vampirovibrionales bacterium]